MSHTPGPWKLDKWNGYLLSSENTSIVKFDVARTRIEDAHLIAAAPDLLEACEKAMAEFEHWQIYGHCRTQLQAAIKKARGKQ